MRYTVIALRTEPVTGSHGYIVFRMTSTVLRDDRVPPNPKIFNSNSDIFKSLSFKHYSDGVRLYSSGGPYLFIPETHPFFNVPLLYLELRHRFFDTFDLSCVVKHMIGQEEYKRLGG